MTSWRILLGGRAADLLGRRRMFLLGMVLLAAFLVIEARSQSPLMPLQLARALGPVLAVIFVLGATMQNIVYSLTLFLPRARSQRRSTSKS